MNPVPSTAEILAYKCLNRPINKKWIDWAVDMLMAGYDTENLVILAGISEEPYNQFELQLLTTRVLEELNLDSSDSTNIYKLYINYLVEKSIKGELAPIAVLHIINDIYIELDCESLLQYFSDLSNARDSLLDSEVQWYVDGLDRSNIDGAIMDYFEEWIEIYGETDDLNK
jgi:hypothetical protein